MMVTLLSTTYKEITANLATFPMQETVNTGILFGRFEMPKSSKLFRSNSKGKVGP